MRVDQISNLEDPQRPDSVRAFLAWATSMLQPDEAAKG
jgi:hypothetical protein